MKLKIRAVGTSAGVILPKDALTHLGKRDVMTKRVDKLTEEIRVLPDTDNCGWGGSP